MHIQQVVAAVSGSWRWGGKQVIQIYVGEWGNSTRRPERCQDVASLVHYRIFLKDCVLSSSVLWNQLVVSTLEDLAVWLQPPYNVSEERLDCVLLEWVILLPNSVPITKTVDLIRVLPLLIRVSQASKVISDFLKQKCYVKSLKITVKVSERILHGQSKDYVQ